MSYWLIERLELMQGPKENILAPYQSRIGKYVPCPALGKERVLTKYTLRQPVYHWYSLFWSPKLFSFFLHSILLIICFCKNLSIG